VKNIFHREDVVRIYHRHRRLFSWIAVVLSYSLVAAIIASLIFILTNTGTNAWAGVDGERFHYMAEVILSGLTPYVDYIDPKPPLLYFTIAGIDLLTPPGSVDIVVVSLLNILSALLIRKIGRDEYGEIAGYSAGMLFLVASVLVQGFFLFSEQFVVVLLLLGFILARDHHYAYAGLLVGLACGYKQYAALAFIPFLYLMYSRKEGPWYLLVLPAAAVITSIFGLFYIFYGQAATLNALVWTFGIGPTYLQGATAGVPDYHATSIIGLAINVLASVVMVFPTLLFALASIARRGFRTREERTLGLLVLVFLSTILIRQYLHYWILALPFLALLACREFSDK